MKPKLTIAVRRGLKDIADLAGADIDAESGFDDRRFKGKRLADANAALRWIACLDDKPRPPKVDQEAARRAVEASQCPVKRLFRNATGVDVDVRVENGEFIVIDPDGQEFRSGLVRKH